MEEAIFQGGTRQAGLYRSWMRAKLGDQADRTFDDEGKAMGRIITGAVVSPNDYIARTGGDVGLLFDRYGNGDVALKVTNVRSCDESLMIFVMPNSRRSSLPHIRGQP